MLVETKETATSPNPTDAEKLSTDLRRMADWLESHPRAASALMQVSVSRFEKPKIILHYLQPLADEFPGRKAKKRRYQDSFVYTILDNGIVFEAWQSSNEKSEPVDVEL